jgi:hypothetical protein
MSSRNPRPPARARDRRASLVYISWYINGYGRPWTSVEQAEQAALDALAVAGRLFRLGHRYCLSRSVLDDLAGHF